MMRKIITAAALVTLAACAQPAETEAEPIVEEAVEEAEALAIDGGPLAGSYTTVTEDGTEALWTLADDGTFTLETDGADPVSGTYTNTILDVGATFCADPDGEEAGEICYAIAEPDEDGSWSATDPDGNVLTAKRAE